MPAPVVVVGVARRLAADRRVRVAAVVAVFVQFAAWFMIMAPLVVRPPQQAAAATGPAGPAPAGIPAIAWQAVTRASERSAANSAGCFMRPGMVGGVMGIESGFGTHAGSTADDRGVVHPPIFGPPLAPGSGFAVIENDAYGRSLGVVGDWAEAVGPTQFLPTTWYYLGRDGDGDGLADPQNLFDAAASTVAFLCAHGYIEGDQEATRRAIFAYNPSSDYVAAVLAKADAIDRDATLIAPPVPTAATGTLVTVGGITVDGSIAPQLQAMLAAARADGIEFGGYGWRSSATQIELRQQNCGTSHYAIFEMPSGQCSPPTAIPGTSMHEQGLAIDFYADGATLTFSSRGFAWLQSHATGYGLHLCTCGEPWHVSVDGS